MSPINCIFDNADAQTSSSDLPENSRLSADVIVIGAGFMGLTAALQLQQRGKSVIVVDKADVSDGESGVSTAQLTEIVDALYQQLIKDFGSAKAKAVAESSRFAMEWVAEKVQKNSIACDLIRAPAYLYGDGVEAFDTISGELKAAQECGVKAIRATIHHKGFESLSALVVPDQIALDPRKYLQGLARIFTEANGQIFHKAAVIEVKDGEPCTVKFSNGSELIGQDVVVATDSPICNLLYLQTKIAAYRTYVLGVKFKSDPPDEGFYYDTQTPYHYFRPIKHNGEDLWLIGGEDHKTGDSEDTQVPYERLETYVRKRFSVASIPFRWSGQVMESIDGLPYIGLNAASKHTYVGTGYQGNGTTFGTLAGLIIADLITDRENPWASLYKATRVKPIAGAVDFIRENTDVMIKMVGDYLIKADAASEHELAPETGAVMDVDGKKVAVYCDSEKHCHAFSAHCTHLNCVVSWNSTEKSWDCPCHGGRFKCTGEVLHGPAIANLKPAEVPEIAGIKA